MDLSKRLFLLFSGLQVFAIRSDWCLKYSSEHHRKLMNNARKGKHIGKILEGSKKKAGHRTGSAYVWKFQYLLDQQHPFHGFYITGF